MFVGNIIRVVGIGEIGINSVTQIEACRLPGVKTFVCDPSSTPEEFTRFLNGNAEVFIVVADLEDEEVNCIAIDVVEECKTTSNLTLGVITFPFLKRGRKAISDAVDTVHEILEIADSTMCITKESLLNLSSSVGKNDLFECLCDNMVTILLNLVDLLSSFLDKDPYALGLALDDSHFFTIAKGCGEVDNRIFEAFEDAIHSPVFRNCCFTSSQSMLLKINRAPNTELSSDFAYELEDFNNSFPRTEIYAIEGDADLPNGKIEVVLMAAGFKKGLPH